MSKKILLSVVLFFFIPGFWFVLWVFQLNRQIHQALDQGWSSPPVELYSSGILLKMQDFLEPALLKTWLLQRDYQPAEKKPLNRLAGGQFIFVKQCPQDLSGGGLLSACIFWRDVSSKDLYTAGFENEKLVVLQKNQKNRKRVFLKPVLFALYEEGQGVFKQSKKLSEIPLHCRWAVMAAEDHRFITHKGISFKGIARAVLKNLRAGRTVEGASTITQQLVKNVFLSPKKTLRRKIKEQIMAVLIELKLGNKDPILELYLNTIYMGQAGPFQVRGLGAASRHYFGKPIQKLNLGECALLAGIIKSPGLYSPFTKPKKALNRRNHILNAMYKIEKVQISAGGRIKELASKAVYDRAKTQKLPNKKKHFIQNTAYFTDTVYKKLQEHKHSIKKGLKVFSTLDPFFQNHAVLAINSHIKWLEKNHFKTRREEFLQAGLISVEVHSGRVLALVGGRDFKISQFNRALQAKRQIGSLIKPFTVMSALMNLPHLQALSAVQDERFTLAYKKQKWSPKNYKDKYYGLTPLYKALALSLNSALADLGLQIEKEPLKSIESLKELIQKTGGPEVRQKHPSIFLGALELSLWETAQMYLSLANFGLFKPLHIIREVQTLEGEALYSREEPGLSQALVLDPKKTAVLLGMLKQVIKSGTAKSLKTFPVPTAGKTGTTNDMRDAWFLGFTPEILTVIWLGFDSNAPHGLTGASGAVPIWKHFMTKNLPRMNRADFSWPKGVIEKQVRAEDIDADEDIVFIEQDSGQDAADRGQDIKQEPESVFLIFEN